MSGVAAVDTVYATLREEILKGTYPPGSHLGEVDLARALGVSRTPVREALRRLGADGLIETEPNRGATVRSWDATQLEHLFAVRSMLEGYAAALAAQHASAAERAELAELCDRMEAVARPGKRQDLTLLTTLNEEFHRAVHVASGNALVPGLVHGLIQVPLVLRTFASYTPARLRQSMEEHRGILAAITAHDPAWAEAAMRNHVLSARSFIQASAGQPPPH